ncbi:hypothetical protein C9374_006672 [Naegleria lovaniensis]|uniref:Endonuclease/exonuclease/phosphatase domain-containing protein n=1 Tax=Naegleria lovaniensis TaxID=51637 RepID=A0AA88KHG9_NAELO|nr:uncharacterized protein C9374_006672 [Naegleria lovaniensis]KAG2379555.1 hypothetical protein C9374_006672 [Naegleria lovaniensis]
MPYCTKRCAAWSHRRENLLQEISEYNADIICLQECDKFEEFWKEKLQSLGYETYFDYQYNPSKEFRPFPYGLAFGFKSEKFDLLERDVVLMEQELLTQHDHYTSRKEMSELEKEEIRHSGNIAQVFALRSKEFLNEGLLITNTHLYWRPESNYVRLRQLMLMIRHTLKIFKKYKDFAIISCGDFNATPASFPYKLMTLPGRVLNENLETEIQGDLIHHGMDFSKLSREHVDRYFRNVEDCEEKVKDYYKSIIQNQNENGQYSEEQLEDYLSVERNKRSESIRELVSYFAQNFPSFISLYSFYGALNPEDHERMKVHDKWNHGEVYYTIFTPDFKSTLDYIFLWKTVKPRFRLTKLLSIPTPEELKIGDEEEAKLPNEKHSSDHISLMVELESTQGEEEQCSQC